MLYYLKDDEQLVVESFTRRWTVNGPGVYFLSPLYKVLRRKAQLLGPTEYLYIRNKLTGDSRKETGPKLYFVGADEEVVEMRQAVVLKQGQYVKLMDKRSGKLRVERGETILFPDPTEEVVGKVMDGIVIDELHAVLTRDTRNGQMQLITAPQVFIPSADDQIVEVRQGVTIKSGQYVRLIDNSSGKLRVERGETTLFLGPTEELVGDVTDGIVIDELHAVLTRDTRSGQMQLITAPQVFIPSADEEIVEVREAITIKVGQYMRFIDRRSGKIRVEQGEASIFLQPDEEILEPVTSGIDVDGQTAVLVRDTTNGQLRLVTEPQVFIPAPNEEIVEVRKRIVLEDHQTVVIKDRNGKYRFKRGTDEERSFFLDPYSEVVSFYWSTGIHKDQRSLKLNALDSRPKFMWYEFEARTQDNVELVIGITFFWQIVDVEAMIRTTDDAPGDICSHARSCIIQSVSQITLEKFLDRFNAVVREAVIERDDQFFIERGVRLNAVEVRSVVCKNSETQSTLQEIIQETTNRLNRLQKQESENEVQLRHIQGEIEAEEMKRRLLELKREHSLLQANAEGEAEARRVQSFLANMDETVPLADRIEIFNTLRKQEVLEALSKGSAQIYFTPSDVDLSIEAKSSNGPTNPLRR